jgi:hypothetical protein
MRATNSRGGTGGGFGVDLNMSRWRMEAAAGTGFEVMLSVVFIMDAGGIPANRHA